MRRNFRKSSGVIIDVCHEHGTWLDANEIEQIAGFILSGGNPSPQFFQQPPRSQGEAHAAVEFARIRAHHERDSRDEMQPGGFVGSIVDLLAGLLS